MSLEPGEACVDIHADNFTGYGNSCQPHPVNDWFYSDGMKKSDSHDPADVLHANVEALLAHHTGRKPDGSVVWHRLVSQYHIANGTAQRIKESNTSIGIDMVAKVAKAFGLEAWQLLVPGLDPTNLPVFAMTEVERRLYANLRAAVEQMSATH